MLHDSDEENLTVFVGLGDKCLSIRILNPITSFRSAKN
jgi:hypothetical protein